MRKRLLAASALTLLCIGLSVATLMSSGCSMRRVLDLQNPTYVIRDIRPRVDIALPLSASSIDFDFVLDVDNPNRIGLHLDRVDFSIFVNDTRVIDGVTDQPADIPAHGIGSVRIRARVGYQNVRLVFREIAEMVQGNHAGYEIRGTAYYRTPFGQRRYPIHVLHPRSDVPPQP